MPQTIAEIHSTIVAAAAEMLHAGDQTALAPEDVVGVISDLLAMTFFGGMVDPGDEAAVRSNMADVTEFVVQRLRAAGAAVERMAQ